MTTLSSLTRMTEQAVEEKVPKGRKFPFPMEGDALLPSQFHVNSWLLSFPFNLANGDANNPWIEDLKGDARKIDRGAAYLQFLDLFNYLASDSIVYLLPATPGLQDQTYVANLGIVPPVGKRDQFILSKFKSPPRRGEEEPGRKFMESLGFTVTQSPEYWEGEADLKYVRENIYFGGYGVRSDAKAYLWMEEQFDMKIIPIKMSDPYLYHFDCQFFPIDDDSVLACTEVMDPGDVKKMEKFVDIIPVSKDDAYMGICNSVRYGELFLTADLSSGFKPGSEEDDMEKHKRKSIEEICIRRQMEAVYFDLFEFTKSGALLSCLVAHLNYPDYGKGYS